MIYTFKDWQNETKYTYLCLGGGGVQKDKALRSPSSVCNFGVRRILFFTKYFIYGNGNDNGVQIVHSNKNTFHV